MIPTLSAFDCATLLEKHIHSGEDDLSISHCYPWKNTFTTLPIVFHEDKIVLKEMLDPAEDDSLK